MTDEQLDALIRALMIGIGTLGKTIASAGDAVVAAIRDSKRYEETDITK